MHVRPLFVTVVVAIVAAGLTGFSGRSQADFPKANPKLVAKPSSASQSLVQKSELSEAAGDIADISNADASNADASNVDVSNVDVSNTDSVRKLGQLSEGESGQPKPKPLAKVQAHSLKGQAAATLYVNHLPLFTFVEVGDRPKSDEFESAAAKSDQRKAPESKLVSPTEASGPLEQATRLAAALNNLSTEAPYQDGAITFTPAWDEQQQAYQVKWGDRTLITLDRSTRLSDSTGDVAEDLRQGINRLRRLMNQDAAQRIDQLSRAEIARLRPEPESQSQPMAEPMAEPMAQGQFLTQGWASWYGPGFHGRLTANGEIYNQNAMTAAHKSLPFGTRIRVTNLDNGLSAVVRINDRGPYIDGREIDLSAAAAAAVGAVHAGVAPVRLEILN